MEKRRSISRLRNRMHPCEAAWPTEATILDLVYETAVRNPRDEWSHSGPVGDKLQEVLELDDTTFNLSVQRSSLRSRAPGPRLNAIFSSDTV